MIVEPDFFDHWKTKLIIDLLGDPCAPIYVQRLWAHCQNRKTHRFPRVNPSVLKAICNAPCEAEKLESALVESGFVDLEKDGGTEEWVVHEWDVVNASLVSAWVNGAKGGRPRNKTQQKPMGFNPDNPRGTRSKAIDKIEKIDKIECAARAGAGGKFQKVHERAGEICAARDDWNLKHELVFMALKNCPGPNQDKAVQNFIMDAASMGAAPDNPMSMLRKYLQNADFYEGGGGPSGRGGGGKVSRGENPEPTRSNGTYDPDPEIETPSERRERLKREGKLRPSGVGYAKSNQRKAEEVNA